MRSSKGDIDPGNRTYLIDTHTFVWAVFDPSKLSRKVRVLFEDTETQLILSVASIWEIALKADKGKIDAPAGLVDKALAAFRIAELPIRTVHVRQASMLPIREGHKDPFDRLIVAQALSEHLPLITNDALLKRHYQSLEITW